MILANMRASGTRLLAWGAVAAVASLAGAMYFTREAPAAVNGSPPSAQTSATGAIGCLGRIEPEDGVIKVTAAYVGGVPPVVEALRVAENAEVAAGQVLAIMQGGELIDAAIREAAARVEAARKRLAQAKDPPKAADVSERETAVRRLEAELARARTELARFERLRKTDDVPEVELAERRAAAVAAEHALEEARQRLRSLTDVRPGAVEVAQAELEIAIAMAERAAVNRESLTVRAPAAGRVLQIRAHAGEQVGGDGVLDLAKTRRMYAIAEVYETDARRVRPGQTASISGPQLAAPIAGTVERIGGAIAKSQVQPADPAAFSDTRIVPVHIRLADPAAVAGLIHGKVSVTIQP
jgi:HlyD family secretion protein